MGLEMGSGTPIPTEREITNLMPQNRRAYAVVRQYFGLPVGTERFEAIGAVYRTLNQAAIGGNLQPPLTPDIANAVDTFDLVAQRDGSLDRHFMSAEFLLEAVFEHGYRSEGV